MSNLPEKVSNLPIQNMGELGSASELLAQAGFLGCKNAGEGFVVMSQCQQSGMTLLDFQQRYHYRQGRFSKQAHNMLAEFEARGGKFKIIERSADRACIELKKGVNEYTSDIKWEDAKEEPFPYQGSETAQMAELNKPFAERNLKAKYKTPHSRKQMLWARAISDGVSTIDPGVRGGVYTPEETEDFQDAEAPSPVGPKETVRPLKNINEPPKAGNGGINTNTPDYSQTAPTAEKTPFEAAREQKATPKEIDYEVCPVGPLKGQYWGQMPDKTLKQAMDVPDEKLGPAYKEIIKRILNIRAEKGQSVK